MCKRNDYFIIISVHHLVRMCVAHVEFKMKKRNHQNNGTKQVQHDERTGFVHEMQLQRIKRKRERKKKQERNE